MHLKTQTPCFKPSFSSSQVLVFLKLNYFLATWKSDEIKNLAIPGFKGEKEKEMLKTREEIQDLVKEPAKAIKKFLFAIFGEITYEQIEFANKVLKTTIDSHYRAGEPHRQSAVTLALFVLYESFIGMSGVSREDSAEELNKSIPVGGKTRWKHKNTLTWACPKCGQQLISYSKEFVERNDICLDCIKSDLLEEFKSIMEDPDSSIRDISLFISKCFNADSLGVRVATTSFFREALEAYYSIASRGHQVYHKAYFAMGKFLIAMRKKEEVNGCVDILAIDTSIEKILNMFDAI